MFYLEDKRKIPKNNVENLNPGYKYVLFNISSMSLYTSAKMEHLNSDALLLVMPQEKHSKVYNSQNDRPLQIRFQLKSVGFY